MAVASRIEAMENRIHFATYLLSDYFPTEEGLTLQFSGYSYDYYQGEAATFPSAQLTYVYNWVSFEGERVLQELEREQVQYQAEDVEKAYMRLDSTGVWELGVLNEDGLTRYVPPVRRATTQLYDGQVLSYSGEMRSPDAVIQTIAKTYIEGQEVLTVADDWRVTAVRLRMEVTASATVRDPNGEQVHLAITGTNYFWVGRGIGEVKEKSDFIHTFRWSDGTTRVNHYGNQYTLTSTSILPRWASLVDGKLTVNGTDAAEYIVFADDNGALRVTMNGESFTCSGVGSIVVNGNGGDDAITAAGLTQNASLSGGSGHDTIVGSESADLLAGGDGNDVIRGGGGMDTINGNFGDDEISGGIGADSAMGGLGNDTIDGQGGRDRLFAGDGKDLVLGSDGADYIEGRGKSDTIYGGTHNDSIYGGAGADVIHAGDGDDFIDVSPSMIFVDTLNGGAGSDTAWADVNDDVLGVESLNPVGGLIL